MKNSAKKSSSVKKILKKIKPYSFYLILALVSAIISVSLTLYIPVLTGNAIDNIIDKGNVDFASVIQILVYIGVGIGGVALFQWIMTYFTNIVSYRTVRDLRREVFEKFNTVPLSYIDTTPHGDLISRVINDVDAVGDGLTQMFLQLFSGIVTIVGTLVFMLTINWKIALVVVVLTPLSLFVAAFIGIARALTGSPKLLILDDSFSALDFATDAALRKALRENTKDMTVIIVTQRCSTIKNADLILVLDDGRLVGKGPHDELFESCETYREICLSQLNEEEAKR